MERYSDYQKLQQLLNDPKYVPYVNVAKKAVYYLSYYLILILQTIHAFVIRHPRISDWLGYIFSLYMSYLTIRRVIRLLKSSIYVILAVAGLWVWQRGVSQVVLMDLPFLIDRLKTYAYQIPRNSNAFFFEDAYAPVVDMYQALQSLF